MSWLSNGTLILMLMHADSERDGDDYEGALEKKSLQVPSKIELYIMCRTSVSHNNGRWILIWIVH